MSANTPPVMHLCCRNVDVDGDGNGVDSGNVDGGGDSVLIYYVFNGATVTVY